MNEHNNNNIDNNISNRNNSYKPQLLEKGKRKRKPNPLTGNKENNLQGSH